MSENILDYENKFTYERLYISLLNCGLYTGKCLSPGSSETIGKSRDYNDYFALLTQLSPRSHPRHLVGKRTAQKDAIKDITSDSQVNSYFPYRWSLACPTLNIYFYLFLYFYLTRITINNGTPHLKSPKNQNRRAALGRPAIKLLEGASTSLRPKIYTRGRNQSF